MCVCVWEGGCSVWVGVCMTFVMCGCVGVLTIVWVFGNMCTCIYCVFVLFRFCLFILICY